MNARYRVSRYLSLLVLVITVHVAGTAHAVNRNDMFAELEKINVSWKDVAIKFWINDFENESDPGVLVGDRLTYRAVSDQPAFFAFILIDARGNVAALKPDATADGGISGASRTLVFPDEQQSEMGLNVIEQAEPLGKETIFLLASDQALPASVFEIGAREDYVNYGNDVDRVRALVTRLNKYADSLNLTSLRYEYYVDSDTQFSTRGIRREITERIEEVEVTTNAVVIANAEATDTVLPIKSTPIVINDINFEYDSDVLTSSGINQLEVLGSELVDRQGQDDLPRIVLTGHTDSTGPADYNMSLSEKRSAASKRFLVEEFGLPADFINTHGLGESQPITPNDTKEGRARNRRVGVEIVQ
ncbi:MAG: OmpA family protein [Granulosicoccus sp.]